MFFTVRVVTHSRQAISVTVLSTTLQFSPTICYELTSTSGGIMCWARCRQVTVVARATYRTKEVTVTLGQSLSVSVIEVEHTSNYQC